MPTDSSARAMALPANNPGKHGTANKSLSALLDSKGRGVE